MLLLLSQLIWPLPACNTPQGGKHTRREALNCSSDTSIFYFHLTPLLFSPNTANPQSSWAITFYCCAVFIFTAGYRWYLWKKNSTWWLIFLRQRSLLACWRHYNKHALKSHFSHPRCTLSSTSLLTKNLIHKRWEDRNRFLPKNK